MPLPADIAAHIESTKRIVGAVQANPGLLNFPELAFLKAFKNGTVHEEPEDVTEPEEPSEFMAREVQLPPAIPINVPEAPEDADWCAAGTKKSEAAQALAA
eukprot:CAMPEP_0119277692 /NCGR_PEP_ID=MMETSP1329-20130426/17690_1 /TAXON_ID=114041 /ORGANISM="Genus nov. species nov., Strain RCC1024" /LENGTH=100 /DNA_ID=CAMNT_0007278181 /DNA_START=72 /DNA_END=370 /DNA_ORIENTATION=-